MMYTQCPSCKTTYGISVAQLRSGRGEVLCQDCQVAFNALNSLSDNPRDAIADGTRALHLPVLGSQHAIDHSPLNSTAGRMSSDVVAPSLSIGSATQRNIYAKMDHDEDFAHERPTSLIQNLAWTLGTLLLAAMMVAQVALFEGKQLLQDPQLRPWLELGCEPLQCKLPDYRASNDIQIINRSLRPTADDTDGLEFSLVIANQAPLPQAFPAIKLSLTGIGGSILQSRVFKPMDYLVDNTAKQMPVGKPFPIKLLLAKPDSEVAGFVFDLI